MSGREKQTWALALCFSLALHGALLWQARVSAAGESGRGKPAPTITRVRFNTTGAAPSRLNAIAEPRPRPQPQPKVEKGPAPAAVPVVPAEPQAASEPLSQLPVSGSEDSSVPVPGASSLAELRQAYHSELMAHIEASKFYPDAARRRGVTGGVRVEFMVATGGAAVALECGRGPGILVQAACEAVRRAVPLPAPPSELHLPLPVSFVMDYSLK